MSDTVTQLDPAKRAQAVQRFNALAKEWRSEIPDPDDSPSDYNECVVSALETAAIDTDIEATAENLAAIFDTEGVEWGWSQQSGLSSLAFVKRFGHFPEAQPGVADLVETLLQGAPAPAPTPGPPAAPETATMYAGALVFEDGEMLYLAKLDGSSHALSIHLEHAKLTDRKATVDRLLPRVLQRHAEQRARWGPTHLPKAAVSAHLVEVTMTPKLIS